MRLLAAWVLIHLSVPAPVLIQADGRVRLRVDTSEAAAVLAIVAMRQAGQPVPDSVWRRLFASEPYRRLAQRETAMKRPFTEQAFREFVLSDDLAARAGALRRTLDDWSSRDLPASARRVLAYLPPEARIRAVVYPVLKPQPNSFVFDVRGDPAIFLSLDPQQSAAEFENTVAHELHHIGFASVSPSPDSSAARSSARIRSALEWMGAFGEGFAMLAAAGGPDTHPHASSPAADRERWDRDMAAFNQDLGKLEAFFLDVLEGRLATQEAVRRRGFSFFGVQGPWYTVGYRMAVVIERRYGRAALIAAMTDPPRLLARYNAAAAELNAAGTPPLALWSSRLLREISPR
ncbi:MAG TPA: DUF5700 domain-containing putative Zn-dependent protease [Gemmatimonadales bacterium]|nr:DUF5700 domain-containing putative Zn-dependent protease [Gemmatimonadales bacterium]